MFASLTNGTKCLWNLFFSKIVCTKNVIELVSAAALTSAAAVRKIPKANFTYAPLSSITDGCSDESVKNPPVSVTPLGEATLSLCRTFNSINNDTNNNNFGGNSNKSCDFRSPPCKRVKLQNRPCLDFEKMHKQVPEIFVDQNCWLTSAYFSPVTSWV